jgi:hypothetical protein
MRDTAISRRIMSEKGIRAAVAAIKANPPLLNPPSKNPERIASNVCPAKTLLNNRTPRLTERAEKLTSSIGANTGLRTPGVPAGINWQKKKRW